MGKRTAFLGMMVALALAASYVETLIPFAPGIPGVKLGLANLIVLLVLWRSGFADAALVSLVRILLAGFLFGSLSSILYSAAGGALSLCVMQALRRRGYAPVSVSTAGGAAHNLGQLLVAMAVVENLNLLYYAPFLLAAGVATGLLIGAAAGAVLPRLPRS